jgi:hypothetical protein
VFKGLHVAVRADLDQRDGEAAELNAQPGAGMDRNTRYLDIHEEDEFDEAQSAAWVKQATRLAGWGRA